MLSCLSFYANFSDGLSPCVLIWASCASETLRWDKRVLEQDQFNCEITSHFFERAPILSCEVLVDYSKTRNISSFNHLSLGWSSNRKFVNRKLAVWSPQRRFFTIFKSGWCTGWTKTTDEYLIFFDDSIQTTVVSFHTKSLPMVWETWVS